MSRRVLLTGATGFVGSNVYPELIEAGFDVRCASRDPVKAAGKMPGRDWVRLDVEDPSSMEPAMQGIDVVLYLVHSMGAHHRNDFMDVERRAAQALSEAAGNAGVKHIVYLGGVEPKGEPSTHLRSRLQTGEVLRRGHVPTLELRAGMIIGAGSESWRMCSDLARLPAMILPQWLKTRSQPVAIDDVVAALVHAAGLEPNASMVYDLPGPEIVTAREILERIANERGSHPFMLEVPFLNPKVSSYWVRFVTSADYTVARELVQGLTSDLLASNPPLWSHMEGFVPTAFDDAMKQALEGTPAVG